MIKKTALVTGAAGFIGYHLTTTLKKKGVEIIAILLPGEKNPFADRIIEADIRNYGSLQKQLPTSIHYVFHLAAIASVPASVADPRADFETNLLGTFNMLELSRRMPHLKAFIFLSSVSSLERDIVEGYSEKNAYGPSTPYGASKMAGEGYCIAYHRCYGVPVKIIRMFNVYGPRKNALVVYDLIKKIAERPAELPILGDGSQVRDFLYIDDACDGILLITEKGKLGEIYHLASGIPVSIRELINAISSLMGLNNLAIRSEGDTWKGDMQKWFADISKVKSLGFNPKVDLKEGLINTIEWFMEDKK